MAVLAISLTTSLVIATWSFALRGLSSTCRLYAARDPSGLALGNVGRGRPLI